MKYLKLFMAIAITSSLFIIGCAKDDDDNTNVEPTYDETELGSNDETARDEYDGAVDDVFKALENTGMSTGRLAKSSAVILPCGVVSIDSTGGVYKFNYDSTINCQKKVLSGSISAALLSGSKWSDVGAEMQLTFTNYKILFMANKQTLTFNGSLVVKNINGGKLWNVLTIGGNKTIVHTINGTIQITFDNNVNDTRTWVISKKRTYSSTDGSIGGVNWTLEADGSIAETGSGKNGDPFVTTIPIPLMWENCSSTGSFEGPFVATVGELLYTSGVNSMRAETGYTYNPTSKNITQVNDCSSTGYKLTYTINGKKTINFQYY